MDEIRFFWIFLCFLLSFWRGLPAAAFLTLCADGVFLFTEQYAVGMAFFLFVQWAYLCNLNGTAFLWRWLLLLPFIGFLQPFVLGFGYAALFLRHFLLAWQRKQAQPACKLYLFGLVLFLCCDMLVVWGYLVSPVPDLVWLFYAPSQLFLALTASAVRERCVTPRA